MSPKLRFKADDGSEFPEWEEKKLGDVCDIVGGGTPDTEQPEYWGGDVNWFTPSEIGETKYVVKSSRQISKLGLLKSSAKLLPEGTILLTSRATLGEMAIAKQECCTNQGFQSLIVKHECLNEFIYYCQLIIKRYCEKHASGSTFLEISKKEIAGCKLGVPSPPEQKKIALFLSTIDDIITTTEAELTAWEERKRGVMQKIFNREVRFKADDGSEFPEWEEKRLGDDVSFINGRAYSQDELLVTGKYQVLRVGNLFTNDTYYYSNMELEEDKYIEDGDLIYAWSATFGPRIYHGKKCIYHYHIWKLKFDEKKISKVFLNYLLEHDVENIKSQRTGGTMVHITKTTMESRQLLFPSLFEQEKIADCLSSLDDVINQVKAELSAWKEFKKGLLQQMFV